VLTWGHRPQNIDAGQDRPKVVGRPTDKREDAPWSERQDASIAVQDAFRHSATKPNAVLDALFQPQEFKAVKRGKMPFNPCTGMDDAHEADPDSNREWLAPE